LIDCTLWGDYEGKLEDRNAKKFTALYKEKIRTIIPESTEIHLFTPCEIYMDSYDCRSKTEGKYFLENEAQVRTFAAENEVPIDKIFENYADYDFEYDPFVFFVELNAPAASGILADENGVRFIHTGESGYCNVAAFPKDYAYYLDEAVPCSDGGVWQRIHAHDINYDPLFVEGEAYGLSKSGMQKVWDDTGMNGFQGIYLPDETSYESFIDLCDRNNLLEFGSIREILEENGSIDFQEYSLCVKLDCYSDNSKYLWHRTRIDYGVIQMGSEISYNYNSRASECSLAYILIPKTYLSEDNYRVNSNLK